MNKYIFALSCKSNGFIGKAFIIGVVVFEIKTDTVVEIIDKFTARCPIEGEINPWVEKNVLLRVKDIKEDCKDYREMLEKFAVFYNKYYKKYRQTEFIYHMGIPVEAEVIIDMYNMGLIDMPDTKFIDKFCRIFFWLDVAGCLQTAGYNSTDVNGYLRARGELSYNKYGEYGNPHNPLWESYAIGLAYIDLMRSREDR